jgi:ComF family protein
MRIPILSEIYYLFFPKLCEVCGGGLVHGEKILCIRCLVNLPRTDYHDDPFNKTTELFAGLIPFVKASSFYYYSKHNSFSSIILHLKYHGKQDIGLFFGAIFGHELLKADFCDSIDVILPVPLHKKRLKERGYNQSLCIAQGLSNATGIAIDTHSVVRIINTKTQTRKTKYNRYDNVEQIFKLQDNHSLSNKHVLVLDDVITTGATIESLCEAIVMVEGIKISIVSLGIVQ